MRNMVTPVRSAIIKKQEKYWQGWEDTWKLEPLYSVGRNIKGTSDIENKEGPQKFKTTT